MLIAAAKWSDDTSVEAGNFEGFWWFLCEQEHGLRFGVGLGSFFIAIISRGCLSTLGGDSSLLLIFFWMGASAGGITAKIIGSWIPTY